MEDKNECINDHRIHFVIINRTTGSGYPGLWSDLKLKVLGICTHKCRNINTKAPTAIDKWVDLFPFMENLEWDKIFQLPYRITTETYIQSFQYKF